jgi:hypothetical protein
MIRTDYQAKYRCIMKRRIRREGIVIPWDIPTDQLIRLYQMVIKRERAA